MNTLIHNFSDDNRPYAKVKVGKVDLNGLLDSGASCSILGKGSENFADQLNLPRYEISTFLKTADGTSHPANYDLNIPYTLLMIKPELFLPL